MTISTATRLLLSALCLSVSYPCLASECGWTVEYKNFPNQINYHSTCNHDASLRVTLVSLQEYSSNVPLPNMVLFNMPYASDWSWLDDAFGADTPFQGFNCVMNKYMSELSSPLQIGSNCYFNLTTYLFEELAHIDIYNLTQKLMDKYSFKWDMDLADWPWISPIDHLRLCLEIQSTVDGHEFFNFSSGEMWVNVSFDADFEVSFPTYFECNGQINGDVKVDVSGETASLVTVCIDIPYCDGAIYYDPIVSSNYKASSDSTLSVGEIAGIVVGCLLFLLCIGVCVCYCRYNRKKEPDYAGLLAMSSKTPTKK